MSEELRRRIIAYRTTMAVVQSMPTQETYFCKQLFVKTILPKGNARTAVNIRNTWPRTPTKRLYPMSYSSVYKKKLPAELKSSEHSLHNNHITRLQGK